MSFTNSPCSILTLQKPGDSIDSSRLPCTGLDKLPALIVRGLPADWVSCTPNKVDRIRSQAARQQWVALRGQDVAGFVKFHELARWLF